MFPAYVLAPVGIHGLENVKINSRLLDNVCCTRGRCLKYSSFKSHPLPTREKSLISMATLSLYYKHRRRLLRCTVHWRNRSFEFILSGSSLGETKSNNNSGSGHQHGPCVSLPPSQFYQNEGSPVETRVDKASGAPMESLSLFTPPGQHAPPPPSSP